MVATLLDKGHFDPTVINGGVIHAYGSNARAGEGEWMVVEADESDGSFNRLPATIAIVTNIDPEHMEHWGSFDALRKGFYDFVTGIPFYGLAVCCTDHAEVQALVGKISDRRVVTFGFNPQADVRAVNLSYKAGVAQFDIVLNGEAEGGEAPVIRGCTLPMPGDHNVSNALAAVAVARHLGMKKDEIREALAAFGGVNRRFTKVAEINGVTIIDDYGHHPVEIAAVLKAARQATAGVEGARVIAVHQPHRYTRLHALFEEFCTCFNEADVVAIAEIYAAGEEPIAGASRDDLVTGLIRHGHRHARALLTLDRATQITAGNQIAARKLSVRETETLVKKMGEDFSLKPQTAKHDKSRDLKRIEEELSDLLMAQVEVRVKKRVKRDGRMRETGEIAIQFSSLEALNGVIERLRG